MSIKKKITSIESKVSLQPKAGLPMDIDLLLQKLGDRWYAFWQLNGEMYFQLSREVGKGIRG